MNFHNFLQWEAASRDGIDFKKIYVDMADDFVAGAMLSQIIYWNLPNREGVSKLSVERDGRLWLAKSHKSWWDECRISEWPAKRALKILEAKRLVTVKVFKFNGTPTIHISLNDEEFLNAWNHKLRQNPKVGNPLFGKEGPLDSAGSHESKVGNSNIGKEVLPTLDNRQSLLSYKEEHRLQQRVQAERVVARPKDRDKKESRFTNDQLFPDKEKTSAKDTFEYKAARKLYETICRNGKGSNCTKSSLSSWSKCFHTFLNKENAPAKDDFRKMLCWYCDKFPDIAKLYIPPALCAKSFCEKYAKIVVAKERRDADEDKQINKSDPCVAERDESHIATVTQFRWECRKDEINGSTETKDMLRKDYSYIYKEIFGNDDLSMETLDEDAAVFE